MIGFLEAENLPPYPPHMGYSPKSLLAALLIATASCMAQPPSSEDDSDKVEKQNKERINAVLQLNIPRIVWKGLAYKDAWQSLEKLIRSADPAGKGVKLFLPETKEEPEQSKAPPPQPQNIPGLDPPPDLSPKGDPTDPSGTGDIRVNARNIRVLDAISYLADIKNYKIRVEGYGDQQGVHLYDAGAFFEEERIELKLSDSVRTMLMLEHRKQATTGGWLSKELDWKGQLLFDAQLNKYARVEWKNGDTKLVVTSSPADDWKLRHHVASLEASVAYDIYIAPNKGEKKLAEATMALSKITLKNLEIDAPTLGQALEQLQMECRKVSGTKEESLKWPFLQPKLAEIGPVSFSLSEGNAADVLFPMLFKLGCKFEGQPNGQWGITARRMEDKDLFTIYEYKVPPSLFRKSAAQQREEEKKLKASKGAPTDPILCGGGGGRPPRVRDAFAMYSPASSTLILKETTEGYLIFRYAAQKAMAENKSIAEFLP